MSNSIYAALYRQEGLAREMNVIANNLANSSTTGFKADRAIFAEFIVATGPDTPSLSMGGLSAHAFEMAQGGLTMTGGQFDLAVQGEGFFAIETPAGQRLTRAGHFQLSAEGQLIDTNGNGVLGAGGGPIEIPQGITDIKVGSDGTISAAGAIIDQVGVFLPRDQIGRDNSTYFSSPAGLDPAPEARVVQGALESSNVTPVLEVARMIEVQRAYEAGQSLLDQEDRRLTQLITSVRER